AGLLEEAAREYEVAAPEYKSNGEYQYRISLADMMLDQPGKAREHFARCQELSPGSESASKAYDLMKMLPRPDDGFRWVQEVRPWSRAHARGDRLDAAIRVHLPRGGRDDVGR